MRETSQQTRISGFGLGFPELLIAFVLLALLLPCGSWMYNRYFSIPKVPLADAMAAFNAQARRHPVGRHEPRLSEAEVVAAIRSQVSAIPASSDVKAIYSEIARTKQLPKDASLEPIAGWTVKGGRDYTVWWINLNISVGENRGFGLRIRENNQPAAKPADEPNLERKSFSYHAARQ